MLSTALDSPNRDYGCARTLVIGLDSATFDVMMSLLDKGQLPNLKRLIETGASGILKSTIPPLSPAAWVSAMTGRNPGRHGVFDFRHLDLNQLHGRKETLVNSGEYAGTTIFDQFGEQGMRVGAFYIPLTYPAWKVNGVMVSGPITPDHRRAYTSPPELADRLGPLARHVSPEHLMSFGDEAYLEELIWDTNTHFQLGSQLLEQEGPFDLFWFHLHSLDSVQHRFWRYIEPAWPAVEPEDRTRFAKVINDMYRLADQGVGRLLDKTGPDSTVFVLSDHGARARPRVEVRFNVWLQQQGLLSLWGQNRGDRRLRAIYRRAKSLLPARWRRKAIGQLPETMQTQVTQFSAGSVRWSRTTASFFPMTDPVGGIVINLAGRQPQGCVEANDYDAVRRRIIDQLRQMCDPHTGQPVVREVWCREDVYSGPFVEEAPDILFIVESSYHPASALAQPWIGPTSQLDTEAWSGIHAMDGILIARGPCIASGVRLEEASILDIAPTILYAMGQTIPSDMDGHVLLGIFTSEFRKKQNICYRGPQGLSRNESWTISDEETEAMMARLRALGYVE